ncbi:MAG: hypothetical protein JXQ75_14030 [Phycisphaerae bacterium]|nr:hypothetical protein [Phycisphaerae bacterium]
MDSKWLSKEGASREHREDLAFDAQFSKRTRGIAYFYQEKPYGDPVARRFEEGARQIVRYRMPCVELTYPYTPLTWLMVDFLTGYYLNDVEGCDQDSDAFWARAESAPLYQYEIIVNRSSAERSRAVLRNVVAIYKAITSRGFNLAKPVPVTENSLGEIVPLKGAKRIAALLTLGVDWVHVLEYDRNTLARLKPGQEKTSCINHTEIIFSALADLPAVKVLMTRYNQYSRWEDSSGRKRVLALLRDLIREDRREHNHSMLMRSDSPVVPIGSSLDRVSSRSIALLIENEVELIEWSYLRRLCTKFIVTRSKLVRRMEHVLPGPDFHVLVCRSRGQIISAAKTWACGEIWAPRRIVDRFALLGASELCVNAY